MVCFPLKGRWEAISRIVVRWRTASEIHDANDDAESVHGNEEKDRDSQSFFLNVTNTPLLTGWCLKKIREHCTYVLSVRKPFCTSKDPEANIVMLATGHSLCVRVYCMKSMPGL